MARDELHEWNVAPRLSDAGGPSGWRAQSKPFPKRRVSGAVGARLPHLDHSLDGHDGRSRVFASGAPMPALRQAILDVLDLRPEKQVLDVDARRVVTTMKHADPFRDLSASNRPGRSMCQPRTATEKERAVVARISVTRPLYAAALSGYRMARHEILGGPRNRSWLHSR